jgi:hypothetical protein
VKKRPKEPPAKVEEMVLQNWSKFPQWENAVAEYNKLISDFNKQENKFTYHFLMLKSVEELGLDGEQMKIIYPLIK